MTTRVPSSQSSQHFRLQLMALLCLLLAGLLPGAQASSQVLQLDGSETRISLLPWVSYLRDPQGDLQLPQIIAADKSFRTPASAVTSTLPIPPTMPGYA